MRDVVERVLHRANERLVLSDPVGLDLVANQYASHRRRRTLHERVGGKDRLIRLRPVAEQDGGERDAAERERRGDDEERAEDRDMAEREAGLYSNRAPPAA